MNLFRLDKKDCLIEQLLMSNKKSSTAIDEKEKAINLYNALVNESKSIFYVTYTITKTLTKQARN